MLKVQNWTSKSSQIVDKTQKHTEKKKEDYIIHVL